MPLYKLKLLWEKKGLKIVMWLTGSKYYHLHLDYQNNSSQDLMKVIMYDIIKIGNFEQQMSEEPI